MKFTNELKVILIVLGVILIGYLVQKYFADETLKETKADYDVRIDRLQADSSKLAGQNQRESRRADSLNQAADKQAALYGQSAATISDLKRTISDQAARLSMGEQIDGIGEAIGAQYKAEIERVKQAATPADAGLVAELYKRVLWGELQAAKLDTSLRENARLRVENKQLRDNEPLYRQALSQAKRVFLDEADLDRLFGIGRKAAMKKGAEKIEAIESDLEKNLNGPRR